MDGNVWLQISLQEIGVICAITGLQLTISFSVLNTLYLLIYHDL